MKSMASCGVCLHAWCRCRVTGSVAVSVVVSMLREIECCKTRFGVSCPEELEQELMVKGYHESRRCSRDTYPESYSTKYTSTQRSLRMT